jgi:hypothetical protein
VSRFRAQFSRDLQSSTANSTDPLTKISDIIEGFGRSSILPRQTREHRLHLAETLSVEGKRNSWKFGGDVLVSGSTTSSPHWGAESTSSIPLR